MEQFQRYFIDTLKNHYADFKGRAARSDYWYFMLFYIIIALVLSLIDSILFSSDGSSNGILGSIFSLAAFLPSLGLAIRRLHDTGKSGWWVLAAIIPLLGFLLLIYFFVQDSQPGENQYGQNPKGV